MATAKKAVKKTATKTAKAKAVKATEAPAKKVGTFTAFAIGERVRIPYRAQGKTEAEAIENMLGKTPKGGYCFAHGFTVVDPDGKRTRHEF